MTWFATAALLVRAAASTPDPGTQFATGSIDQAALRGPLRCLVGDAAAPPPRRSGVASPVSGATTGARQRSCTSSYGEAGT